MVQNPTDSTPGPSPQTLLVFISNNFVKDAKCSRLLQYAHTTFQDRFGLVNLSTDYAWKAETAGFLLSQKVSLECSVPTHTQWDTEVGDDWMVCVVRAEHGHVQRMPQSQLPRQLLDGVFFCQFAFNMCLEVDSELSRFASRRRKCLQYGHGFRPIRAVLPIANGWTK